MSTERSAEYDTGEDPDGDPEILKADRAPRQPDQAEGADDSSETGSA
jgi:hypothetical protein